MAMSAKPYKLRNVKGGPPEKKKTLDKRWLLALLLLPLIGWLGYAFRLDNRLQRVRNEQAKWDNMSDEDKRKLTQEERNQIWVQFQLVAGQLTPDQKIVWAREREEKQNAKIREIRAMSPEDKQRWLDDDIRRESERNKKREKALKLIEGGMNPAEARTQVFGDRGRGRGGFGGPGPSGQGPDSPGPGGPGPGAQGSGGPGLGGPGPDGQGPDRPGPGGPGPGGPGPGGPGPDGQGPGAWAGMDPDQRIMQRLANTSSEGRALRYVLSLDIQRRQAEMGLPLTAGAVGPRMIGSGGLPGQGGFGPRGPGGRGPGGGRP